MTARKLRIVPADEGAPIDINALHRADIAKRDWSAVHISADRRAPVFIGDANRRTWR